MFNLNSFNNLKFSKIKKRLGRGISSNLGKTSGKGHKGQKARSGKMGKLLFEGGQSSFYRKLPKWGFNYLKTKSFSIDLLILSKFPFTLISFWLLNKFNFINSGNIFLKIFSKKEINRKFILYNINYSKFITFFYNNLKINFILKKCQT